MKSDKQLQQDVLDELEWEPSVDTNEIGVTVHDGIVTLTGFVPSCMEKRAAEQAVLRVRGVKGIAEEIQVKLPGSSQRTDVDIAQAALNALAWHTLVKDTIQVKVEHGVVTLSGDVDWNYQRAAAEQAVEQLTGVRWVNNIIKVRVRPSIADVKKHIKQALVRSARANATRIQVECRDGEVVLKGIVRSWSERQAAETAAWAAPGVISVIDELQVL